jgi:hypothetical protein
MARGPPRQFGSARRDTAAPWEPERAKPLRKDAGSRAKRKSKGIPGPRPRVVFRWLSEHGGANWPQRFVELADGLATRMESGQLLDLDYSESAGFPPHLVGSPG